LDGGHASRDKQRPWAPPKQAEAEVEKILSTFELLPETPALFDEWKKLVVAHGVCGVETHDARIIAALKVHGISHILTFNEQDTRPHGDPKSPMLPHAKTQRRQDTEYFRRTANSASAGTEQILILTVIPNAR
jgi:hypothetical protein